MKRKVVVTGMGIVSPVGIGIENAWKSIIEGKHAFHKITRFNISEIKVSMNAEILNFEYPDKREGRRMDLFTQYGVLAADEALKNSGMVIGENMDPHRIGCYAGSGIGGISTLENQIRNGQEKGLHRVSPLLAPMIIGNILPGQIAIKFGIKGSAIDIVTACSCGTNAIGEAKRAIEDGHLDAIVSGGSEAPFAPVTYAGFDNMTAMSRRDDPDRCSTPFDKERDGFVMGEGAGMLVLEEEEHAKKRGANILAYLSGYGSTSDAFHITMPDETAEGPMNAIKEAIKDAGINESEVDYINAHGTGTPYNDLVETKAVKMVFGENAPPMSSTKSMTGHLLGAAGAIEAIFCVQAILDGIMPPTIGYKVKDEELDLDYITDGARKKDIKYAMSNSLGFGGHNASIIFKKA